jgi:hypothetical protein
MNHSEKEAKLLNAQNRLKQLQREVEKVEEEIHFYLCGLESGLIREGLKFCGGFVSQNRVRTRLGKKVQGSGLRDVRQS